eukprot:5721607-Prymnesium_polylepis.1
MYKTGCGLSVSCSVSSWCHPVIALAARVRLMRVRARRGGGRHSMRHSGRRSRGSRRGTQRRVGAAQHANAAVVGARRRS